MFKSREKKNQELIDASYNGNLQKVKKLLKNGANIEAQTNNGNTPLHRASQNGKENVVAFLIKNDANIDAQNNSGWTPLHLASCRGKENVVKLLLEKGANPNITNNDGQTPLQLAQLYNQQTYVRAIESFLQQQQEEKQRLEKQQAAAKLKRQQEKEEEFKKACLKKFPTRAALDQELQRLQDLMEKAYASIDKKLNMAAKNAREEYDSLLPLCNWPEYMDASKLNELIEQKEGELRKMEHGDERLAALDELLELKQQLEREERASSKKKPFSGISNIFRKSKSDSNTGERPPVMQVNFSDGDATMSTFSARSTATAAEIISVFHEPPPGSQNPLQDNLDAIEQFKQIVAESQNSIEHLIRVTACLQATNRIKCPRLCLLLPEAGNVATRAMRKNYRLYFLCSHDKSLVKTNIIVNKTRRWVKVAAPIFKCSLFMIHVLLKVYQIPLPIDIAGINLGSNEGLGKMLEHMNDLLGEDEVKELEERLKQAQKWFERASKSNQPQLDSIIANVQEYAQHYENDIPSKAFAHLFSEAYKPSNIGWQDEMTLAAKGSQYAWVKNENVQSWLRTP